MEKTTHKSTTNITMGKRLKLLRNISGYTADELGKLSKISRQSISTWENGGGFSNKSAEKIVNALSKNGYDVSVAWLLFGIGDFPFPRKNNSLQHQLEHIFTNLPRKNYIENNIHAIESEIELFKSKHQDTVVLKVKNTSMYPHLLLGDIVGGIWRDSSCIESETFCIIELNHQLQIRAASKINQHYHIRHLSFDASSTEPYELKAVTLTKIAPIVRVWRAL